METAKNKFSRSSPWVIFYRKINALFHQDPNIETNLSKDDNDKPVITILVHDDVIKANAIQKLLGEFRTFGQVDVIIKVSFIQTWGDDNIRSLFEKAFKDNPILSYTTTGTTSATNSLNYIVFKNEVVQFFNDDLSDVNGQCSTIISRNC